MSVVVSQCLGQENMSLASRDTYEHKDPVTRMILGLSISECVLGTMREDYNSTPSKNAVNKFLF